MTSTLTSPLFAVLCALSLHAHAARAVSVALLPDGVLTLAERDEVRSAVIEAGHTLLDDEEVRAAVDGARGACVHDDVPCLARIALLADADAVVSFARRGEDIHVVVVDADPRVGRATAPSSRVGAAVVDAIATRASLQAPQETLPSAPSALEPKREAEPEPASVGQASAPAAIADAHVTVERGATSTTSQTRPPWALAGAGLAGAGLVALAAGGYAAVLATGSMQEAEDAPFQDDAARFGDTANGQLWLSGGALALGVGAMASGAALIFMDGEP